MAEFSGIDDKSCRIAMGFCSSRLAFLDHTLHGPGVDIPAMFAAVAAGYQQGVDKVLECRSVRLQALASP
jgi:hypothetical protein